MEPDEVIYLRTALHWRAMAHPMRLAVVRKLRIKAMTNEELAVDLNVASGKLYFHTKMLFDAGLIRLVGTRKKRAITEKLYRASAMHFQTEPDANHEGASQFASIDSFVELYKHSAREFPKIVSGPESVSDYRLLQLTPEKAAELGSKFEALLQEAADSRSELEGAIPMALAVMFYRLPSTGSAVDQDAPSTKN